jgi:hypothetical protein
MKPNDYAKVVLHLAPPPEAGANSWVEIDGKRVPCRSLAINIGPNDRLGSLDLTISLHRVNIVFEPPPIETEE